MCYISCNYSSLDRFRQANLGSYMVNAGLNHIAQIVERYALFFEKGIQGIISMLAGRPRIARLHRTITRPLPVHRQLPKDRFSNGKGITRTPAGTSSMLVAKAPSRSKISRKTNFRKK